MMAKGIGTYLGKAFTLALFMVISAFTLFFAYGYRYDFKEQDIRKTSIIDISAKEEDVRVMLEGDEVASRLPYQIKNVLPGKYVVEVMKEGYGLWQRQVDVVEDLVTIVNDVILVPVDPEKFIKTLLAFEERESRFFYGGDYIVELLPGGKVLRVVTFYGNGTAKDEDIELFKSGINDIQTFENRNFLIFFDDGSAAWVSYSKKGFEIFDLPEGAESIRINAGRESLYFLLNGDLYALNVRESEQLEDSPDDFKVVGEVNAFVSAINDDIYFLKGGVLHKTDYKGEAVSKVSEVEGEYVNIGFRNGRNHGALILRDKDQKRSLRIMDKAGTLLSLEEDLKGDVYFNSSDDLLYAGTSGSVNLYEQTSGKKRQILMQTGEFELLGWFSDEGHFLLKAEGAVVLNDIYNSNRYTLIGVAGDDVIYFPSDRVFFFIEKQTLYVMDWIEDR